MRALPLVAMNKKQTMAAKEMSAHSAASRCLDSRAQEIPLDGMRPRRTWSLITAAAELALAEHVGKRPGRDDGEGKGPVVRRGFLPLFAARSFLPTMGTFE